MEQAPEEEKGLDGRKSEGQCPWGERQGHCAKWERAIGHFPSRKETRPRSSC